MAVVTSIASGNWSDPTIWDAGRVPTVGDDVVIASGTVVTIDTNIGEIGSSTSGNVTNALTVQNGATLKWNGDVNCDLRLNGNWIIEDGATIDFNGTTSPNFTLNIRYDTYQYGCKVDTLGDNAIWKLQGYNRGIRWTVLTRNHSAGETVIDVKDVYNWQVGDTLDIIGFSKTSDIYTIVAIDTVNKKITLDKGLTEDKNKFAIVINQTSNIDIRTENLNLTDNSFYFFVSYNPSNILSNFVLQTHGVNSYSVSRIGKVFTQKFDLFANNIVLLNPNGDLNNWGDDWSMKGCVSYGRTIGFFGAVNFDDCAVGGLSYACDLYKYKKTFRNVYIGFIGHVTNPMRNVIALKDSYIINPQYVDTPTLIGENIHIQNISGFLGLTIGSKINGGSLGNLAPINELKIDKAYQSTKIINVEYNDNSITTVTMQNPSQLFISTVDGKHRYFDYYQKTYNQTMTKYNNNEAVEIQAVKQGTFKLTTKALVSAGAFYRWTVAMMKNASQSIPPKFRVLKGNTLIGEQQMTDSINTWEELSITWLADFDGYVTVEFEFTADIGDGSEYFWISDNKNSFHYWSEGYIIPVFPKPDITPDALAEAVWNYSNRTLTSGGGGTGGATADEIWNYPTRSLTSPVDLTTTAEDNIANKVWNATTRTLTAGTRDAEIDSIKSQTDKLKFNVNNDVIAESSNMIPDKSAEIDSIKAQTDKLQFDANNNVKSVAQNSELANLDASISSRASQTSVDAIKTQTDKLQFDANNNVLSNNQNPSFTSADRNKLNSLQNYDDTTIQQKLDFLKKLATNKAEIINNNDGTQTVKIYDDDGITVIATLQINADKTLRLPL